MASWLSWEKAGGDKKESVSNKFLHAYYKDGLQVIEWTPRFAARINGVDEATSSQH